MCTCSVFQRWICKICLQRRLLNIIRICSVVMAVVITKHERHSRYTNNSKPMAPTSQRRVPARNRKLILDLEDEEKDEENVKFLTESGDLSNQKARQFRSRLFSCDLTAPSLLQGYSTLKQPVQAKRSATVRKVIKTQSVEDANAGSSSGKYISLKKKYGYLSPVELDSDSSEEKIEDLYRSPEKLFEKEGSTEHKRGRGLSGEVPKKSNEKKRYGDRVMGRKEENDSDQDWDESKEKHWPSVARSSNNKRKIENMDNQKTSKRRRASAKKFLEEDFILCDWMDDKEDVVSFTDTKAGGSDSISVSRIQNSVSDITRASTSPKSTKKKCDGSSRHASSSLASSSSSSVSSTPNSETKRGQRSMNKNVKVCLFNFSFLCHAPQKQIFSFILLL